MAPPPGLCEHCEECKSHVKSPHCKASRLNCNGKHCKSLSTCARCRGARYCSRACQVKHWPQHKTFCLPKDLLQQTLKRLGPQAETLHKFFGKFCQKLFCFLEKPAISALELKQQGRARIETHVFLIEMTSRETMIGKAKKGKSVGCLSFRVLRARGVPTQELYQIIGYEDAPDHARDNLKAMIAPQPNHLRIFFLETSGVLPAPLNGYILPTDISNWPDEHLDQYDPDWYQGLLKSIEQNSDLRGQVPPNMDEFTMDGDLAELMRECMMLPPARPSSPVD